MPGKVLLNLTAVLFLFVHFYLYESFCNNYFLCESFCMNYFRFNYKIKLHAYKLNILKHYIKTRLTGEKIHILSELFGINVSANYECQLNKLTGQCN